ncbi:MAG TPA: leucine-rich repeat protein [Burkholderiales bacterium]|nr:leucine-rich repeat protein [Burkholderiales bacterium]
MQECCLGERPECSISNVVVTPVEGGYEVSWDGYAPYWAVSVDGDEIVLNTVSPFTFAYDGMYLSLDIYGVTVEIPEGPEFLCIQYSEITPVECNVEIESIEYSEGTYTITWSGSGANIFTFMLNNDLGELAPSAPPTTELTPGFEVNNIVLEAYNDDVGEPCDRQEIDVTEIQVNDFDGVYIGVFPSFVCEGVLTWSVTQATPGFTFDLEDLDVNINGSGLGEVVVSVYCDEVLIGLVVYTLIPSGLRLVYSEGNLPANDLAAWNTLFNLPAQGTAFTSMVTAGDTVTLIGGAGITLANTIFLYNTDLKEIHDDSGCIVAAGNNCFVNCVMDAIELDSLASAGIATFRGLTITTLVLPALVTAGDGCFGSCIITTLTLAALETAGVGCFQQCTATAYTLTALETAGESCFQSTVAASFTLPSLLTIGNFGFYDNTVVTTILTAALTALGTTVGNNSVYLGCTSLTAVTVPTALQTVDGGNPDGDLVYASGTLGAVITYV